MTLKGITIDAAPLVFRQGKVAQIAADHSYYDLEMAPAYLLDIGLLREKGRPASVFDPQTRWEPLKPGTEARLRLVLFQHVVTDEVAVSLNGVTSKRDLVDPQWKDARIFSPAPQPETVTPGWLVIDLDQQKLTRIEFTVPVALMKRGDKTVAISVDRRGPFSKSVKVEKVELHLK